MDQLVPYVVANICAVAAVGYMAANRDRGALPVPVPERKEESGKVESRKVESGKVDGQGAVGPVAAAVMGAESVATRSGTLVVAPHIFKGIERIEPPIYFWAIAACSGHDKQNLASAALQIINKEINILQAITGISNNDNNFLLNPPGQVSLDNVNGAILTMMSEVFFWDIESTDLFWYVLKYISLGAEYKPIIRSSSYMDLVKSFFKYFKDSITEEVKNRFAQLTGMVHTFIDTHLKKDTPLDLHIDDPSVVYKYQEDIKNILQGCVEKGLSSGNIEVNDSLLDLFEDENVADIKHIADSFKSYTDTVKDLPEKLIRELGDFAMLVDARRDHDGDDIGVKIKEEMDQRYSLIIPHDYKLKAEKKPQLLRMFAVHFLYISQTREPEGIAEKKAAD